MAANEIAKFLLASCKNLRFFESYMFGSALNGIGYDIDILIVGDRGERLFNLKKEIEFAGENLPLDVLYMDYSEAIETNFINNEGCMMLSVLVQDSSPPNLLE
jgi:predicted nucleotidyltransferase